MGMSRGVGAALLAAAVVLSGCGTGDESATTTSPSAEAPVNPWDLPLEERPDLFDPCAEIPVTAIEEGVGGAVESEEQLRIERRGELLSCGWRNQEVILNILSTWKSRDEYLNDEMYIASEHSVADRTGLRLTNSGARSCRHVLFTSSGTIFTSVDLVHGLSAFKGENFTTPCEVLDDAIMPALNYLPEGDF